MKKNSDTQHSAFGRRNFIKTAAVGMVGTAGLGLLPAMTYSQGGKVASRTREEKLKQIASNSYAVNQLFKKRAYPGRPESAETLELKKKYRELTLIDFPQFTIDTYPGVKAMDFWSSLFGDVNDDTMLTKTERDGQTSYNICRRP